MRALFNRVCDLFAATPVQTAILMFGTAAATHHYVTGDGFVFVDGFLIVSAVYFINIRPVLRKKGLV